MGRISKGAMMRAQKQSVPRYTDVDLENARLQGKNEAIKEIKERYGKMWAQECQNDVIMDSLQLLVAASCDVLVSEFGWAPVTKKNSKLAKFADSVVNKINDACGDNLQEYAKHVYDVTNVGFVESED